MPAPRLPEHVGARRMIKLGEKPMFLEDLAELLDGG